MSFTWSHPDGSALVLHHVSLTGCVGPTGSYAFQSTDGGGNTGWTFNPASKVGLFDSGGIVSQDYVSYTNCVHGPIGATSAQHKLICGSHSTDGGGNLGIRFGALSATASLGGTITPAGAITKAVTRSLGGTVTPAGTVVKAISRALAGAITPTGAVVKALARSLGGAITPAGSVAKTASKALGGTVTPAGAVTKAVSKPLGGTVTPTGRALVLPFGRIGDWIRTTVEKVISKRSVRKV